MPTGLIVDIAALLNAMYAEHMQARLKVRGHR